MPQFRSKPTLITAINFTDLVEYGKENGGNIVKGMPWSFKYEGFPVTHETDGCYLILSRGETLKFFRGDMLVITGNRTIFTCDRDLFEQLFDHVQQTGVQRMITEKIKNVLIEAAQVVAWRNQDVSTEDGTFATTCTDAIIRLEQALCDALNTSSDDVVLEEILPLIGRL